MRPTPARLLPLLAAVTAAVAGLGAVVGPSAATPPGSTTGSGSSRGAQVMPADPANPDNPLAGHTWGVYTGTAEPSWRPYLAATGETKRALRTIVFTPKAKFFGKWIPDNQIAGKVREYVANATRHDPDALVQLTAFRLDPWEADTCRTLPTLAQQRSYRTWMRRFADAIGDANAAVVLQPDGPFARCAPGGSTVYSDLLATAVKQLGEQPNTTTYIEMGSNDWFGGDPDDAVRLLLRAGVADARGFALDTSHFDSVVDEIRFGTRIVQGLADHGVPDAHFTIDTSDSGRPFTGREYKAAYGDDAVLGHARACQDADMADPTTKPCVTLGIPPTTKVARRAWGLPRPVRALAAEHVDGYLWVSRPWLYQQSGPFDLDRALDLIRTTPFG